MTLWDFDISRFRVRDNGLSGFRVSVFWTEPNNIASQMNNSISTFYSFDGLSLLEPKNATEGKFLIIAFVFFD